MTADLPTLEWDLDALAEAPRPQPRRRRGTASPVTTLVAVLALATGIVVGGGLRAGISPATPDSGAIPEARLSLLDARLENGPVATLRLTVINPDRSAVHLDGITLAGVPGTAGVVASAVGATIGVGYLSESSAGADGVPRITMALSRRIPAGGQDLVDVELRPTCATAGPAMPVSAQVLLDRATTVDIALDGGLNERGALCQQLAATFPVGWSNPIAVPAVHRTGDDLRVTLRGLGAGSRIAGLWVGEDYVSTRGPAPGPGPDTQAVQLVRPAGCPIAENSLPVVPTGLRVLVVRAGDSLLVERHAQIGPALAGWLDAGC